MLQHTQIIELHIKPETHRQGDRFQNVQSNLSKTWNKLTSPKPSNSNKKYPTKNIQTFIWILS